MVVAVLQVSRGRVADSCSRLLDFILSWRFWLLLCAALLLPPSALLIALTHCGRVLVFCFDQAIMLSDVFCTGTPCSLCRLPSAAGCLNGVVCLGARPVACIGAELSCAAIVNCEPLAESVVADPCCLFFALTRSRRLARQRAGRDGPQYGHALHLGRGTHRTRQCVLSSLSLLFALAGSCSVLCASLCSCPERSALSVLLHLPPSLSL